MSIEIGTFAVLTAVIDGDIALGSQIVTVTGSVLAGVGGVIKVVEGDGGRDVCRLSIDGEERGKTGQREEQCEDSLLFHGFFSFYKNI